MLTIICPECGKRLEVSEKYLGRYGRCKACGKKFLVRVPSGQGVCRLEDQEPEPEYALNAQVSAGQDRLSVTCPHCNKIMVVRKKYSGLLIMCRTCGKRVTIPGVLHQKLEQIEETPPLLNLAKGHNRANPAPPIQQPRQHQFDQPRYQQHSGPGLLRTLSELGNHIMGCGCLLISVLVLLFLVMPVSQVALQSPDAESNDQQTGTLQGVQTPANPTLVSRQRFEILDWNWKNGEFGVRTIQGTVRNNTGEKFSYIQIEINLYDNYDRQVGSTFANIANLEPYGTWQFEAVVLEDTATKAKITDITGF